MPKRVIQRTQDRYRQITLESILLEIASLRYSSSEKKVKKTIKLKSSKKVASFPSLRIRPKPKTTQIPINQECANHFSILDEPSINLILLLLYIGIEYHFILELKFMISPSFTMQVFPSFFICFASFSLQVGLDIRVSA